MKNLPINALLLLGMLTGLVSCKTPSSGVVVESYPQTKITINSKLVAGNVGVEEYAARKHNGLLEVQITVQNKTQRDVAFEYMFRWFDSDGMIIESPASTWTPVSLSGKQVQPLNAIAPGSSADDFRFEIRFVRSSTRW